jgi:hypothetical protein
MPEAAERVGCTNKPFPSSAAPGRGGNARARPDAPASRWAGVRRRPALVPAPHELAASAAKHGAPSRPVDRVGTRRGRASNGTLSLDWAEVWTLRAGGRPLARAPYSALPIRTTAARESPGPPREPPRCPWRPTAALLRGKSPRTTARLPGRSVLRDIEDDT